MKKKGYIILSVICAVVLIATGIILGVIMKKQSNKKTYTASIKTAFTVKKEEHYELRWFTPDREIDLCGHATLATAFVLFNYYGVEEETIKFTSQSG